MTKMLGKDACYKSGGINWYKGLAVKLLSELPEYMQTNTGRLDE